VHDDLLDVLEEARRLGFLGPGPVDRHLAHASGFLAAAPRPPGVALDLGSGGGLPGLVLARAWPESEWVLLDANERRTAFLSRAATQLRLADRVVVVRIRAEEAGRRPEHRGRYDLVTTRSFGPPALVAECAAPLLRPGGSLVVSEPPGGVAERWPTEGLAKVGLSPARVVAAGESSFALLVQATACPAAYPRRVGVPGKRPLF
jgi:16S rRNA (guanine527-N7)-methyltransferase